MSMPTWLFVLSIIGTGLSAGLFFAFSSFVMSALNRLPAQQAIAAMQSINLAVLNPVFGALFFGTTLLNAALAIDSLFHLGDIRSNYLFIGSALYVLGSFLITLACNVPLNNKLATLQPDKDSGQLWASYFKAWTFWNHVRTASATISLSLLLMSILR